MSYFPSILSEPQLAISKEDKNLILGAASSSWFKKPLNLSLYLLAIISWVIFMVLATMYLEHLPQNTMLYTVLLWTLLLPLYILGLHYLFFHFGFRPHLHKELRERGYDICLKCGYILIDLPASTNACPECATQRTPLPQDSSNPGRGTG